MVLIYKKEDQYYTLAEMAMKYPKEWEDAIKSEFEFLDKPALIDLLSEASDEFEDILAEQKIYVEPLGSLGGDDLNVLLAPLWG